MIVLEEAIRKGWIPNVPVYLDGMIWEATAIHTTYPEYLNVELQDMIFHKGQNPFLSPSFVQVDSPKKREEILQEPGPMHRAGDVGHDERRPGHGVPEELWRGQAEYAGLRRLPGRGHTGTKDPEGLGEIPMTENGKTAIVKIALEVTTVDGFSGHSDRRQLMEYVKRMDPSQSGSSPTTATRTNVST